MAYKLHKCADGTVPILMDTIDGKAFCVHCHKEVRTIIIDLDLGECVADER